MDRSRSNLKSPLVEEDTTGFSSAGTKIQKPSLQFSVPYLSEGTDERIRSFVGIFYELPFPTFPTPKFNFFVANGWCNGKGTYAQKLKIVNPDHKTVLIETPDQHFTLNEADVPFMAVNFFAEMTLKDAGTYWIQVFLDGKLALEYPLGVRKAEAAPEKPKK